MDRSDLVITLEGTAGDRTTPLPLEDYKRYGRQMILEGFGLPAQLKLKNSSVLVVGAGGLGCPAIQYLAASGIGKIGIIDHDVVELSNLQRQILHTDATIGWNKADSAKVAAQKINPRVEAIAYTFSLTVSNARDIISGFDIVLDCTDNLPTRYLLSDSTAYLSKPLVSGAALKFDGQLCVHNLGDDGPCYRCLFPKPPSVESTGTCEEMGVLGVVTGVIGTMQATEAIKLITGLNDSKPTMLIYSTLATPPFRSMKLRSKRPGCIGCSNPTAASQRILETDYVAFCGGEVTNWVSSGLANSQSSSRVSSGALATILASNEELDIIDVRPPSEFSICHLPRSRNIPLREVLSSPHQHLTGRTTYVVCRLGNDSQIAARALQEASSGSEAVRDLVGGLRAWSSEVDPLFPVY